MTNADNYRMCDLCGELINTLGLSGNCIVNYGAGKYQRWPVNGKTYDVCLNCCKIIDRARNLGILTYSDDELFIQAGYHDENGMWVKNEDG